MEWKKKSCRKLQYNNVYMIYKVFGTGLCWLVQFTDETSFFLYLNAAKK